MVLAGARHPAIHDFGGFPAELYAQRATRRARRPWRCRLPWLLARAGIEAPAVEAEGLDHGIWTVMKRAWPGAEVPVVPLTLVPGASPQQQWAIGAAPRRWPTRACW